MMAVELHFLGWDRPAVELVAERLWRWAQQDAESFRRAVVVVPTAESGRSLRVRVAELAGQAVLMPRVLLLGGLAPAHRVPTPLEEAAAWMSALGQENAVAAWPHVFRLPGDGRSAAEWEESALAELVLGRVQELMRLRGQLELADVSAAEVCRCLREQAHAGSALPEGEVERWEEVADLISRVEGQLRRWGLQTLREAVEEAMQGPPGRGRVVLACVPQVGALARRYLRCRAQAGEGVEVWVHAPQERRSGLDAFGCPVAGGEWESCPLEVPEEAVHVVAHAPAMAAETLRLLQGHAPREVALGVCDARFAPALAVALERAGWRLWLPGRRAAASTEAGRLPGLFQQALAPRGCRAHALSALLRNGALQAAYGVVGEEARQAGLLLDEVEQKDYPEQGAALVGALRRRGGLPYAEEVWQWVQRMGRPETCAEALEEGAGRLAAAPGPACWGRLLQGLAQGMRVWAARAPRGAHLGMLWPLLQSLVCGGAVDDAAREETHVDALGWMELPYAAGGLMVVTGLHEHCVPEAGAVEPFLPESLRRRLGMDHAGLRVARDSFLLAGLVKSRPGRLHVVVARQAPDESPVMPSRLLMRLGAGQDQALARRVRHLLERPESPRPPLEYGRGRWFMGAGAPGWESMAQEDVSLLVPGARSPWAEGGREFSPSAISSFLRNPLAFWVRHVLGLDPRQVYQEQKSSMDALDFGTVAHRVLFRMVRQFPCWREGLSVAEMAEWVRAALEEEFGLRTTLAVRVQRELLEERLLAFVRLHARDLQAGWHTDVEQGLEVPVQGSLGEGMPLSMRLDRVDVNAETGAVRVVDYKTGKHTPQEAHWEALSAESLALFRRWLPQLEPLGVGEAFYRWKDVQLPLYASHVRALYPGRPVQVGYYMLPKKDGLVRWEGWDLALEWEEHALGWCREAARLIRAGRCLLSARDLGLDSYDDFGCLDVEKSLRCMLNLPPLPMEGRGA